jgi:hypothetical protein
MRGHIHHAPWPLQPAEVQIDRLDVLPFLPGVKLDPSQALCHFAADQEVLAWPIIPAMCWKTAPRSSGGRCGGPSRCQTRC